MNLREMRRNVARKVAHSNLPGSLTASKLIRDSEDNKDLDNSLKLVVEGFAFRRNTALPIIETYPAVGRWYKDELLSQIRMYDHPCNELIMEQVIAQMTDFGTAEQIAACFEKYVNDIPDLRAMFVGVMGLYRKYVDWGYVIAYEDKEPVNNINDEDLPILFNRVMNFLAENIARGNSKLDEDLVAIDLKKIFE